MSFSALAISLPIVLASVSNMPELPCTRTGSAQTVAGEADVCELPLPGRPAYIVTVRKTGYTYQMSRAPDGTHWRAPF